jgi:hypothetical protein
MHGCKDQVIACLYLKSMNNLIFQILSIEIQIITTKDICGIKMCPPIMTYSYKNPRLTNMSVWHKKDMMATCFPPTMNTYPTIIGYKKHVKNIIPLIEFSFITTKEIVTQLTFSQWPNFIQCSERAIVKGRTHGTRSGKIHDLIILLTIFGVTCGNLFEVCTFC